LDGVALDAAGDLDVVTRMFGGFVLRFQDVDFLVCRGIERVLRALTFDALLGAIGVLGIRTLRTAVRVGDPADPRTVFLTRRGQPLATNRLTELVHRYVRRAGIQKTGSCHLFRHTMATLMLENGADVRYLQALLGHAQLSTTELYTRVSITQLKAVHQRTHPAHRTLAQRALRRDPDEQQLLSSLAAEATTEERAGAED